MTIEEVMRFVDEAITQTKWAMRANFDADEDEQTQWAHVEHKTDIARRAILALVAQARDEALQEAAKVCEGVPAFIGARSGARIEPTKHDCAKAIRMSIAARAEGGKNER